MPRFPGIMSAKEARSARLKAARIAAGFESAAAAAERFGWAYPTYAQHEGGAGIGKNPGRYARAFRVSEAWLLTGEGGEVVSAQETELRRLYLSLSPSRRDRLLDQARLLRLDEEAHAPDEPAPSEPAGKDRQLRR